MAVQSTSRSAHGSQLWGALLCAASAASFGAMGIFGKLSYDAGVGVLTLLLVRFTLAAGVLGAINAARGRVRRKLDRRTVWIAIGLGGIGYTTQAALFFLALERMDAGITALVLYTYPAFVTIAAVALGRDSLDRVRLLALGLAFLGLVFVLFVGDPGGLDGLGVVFALAAGLAYTAYILVSETVLEDVDSMMLSAIVCAGAAATLGVAAVVSGGVDFGFDAIGWLWLGGLALISTVAAITLFFAGLRVVGPSRAAIISTIEPLVTVVLAVIFFGEEMAPTQVLGGALVLGSVVLLQTIGRGPEPPAA